MRDQSLHIQQPLTPAVLSHLLARGHAAPLSLFVEIPRRTLLHTGRTQGIDFAMVSAHLARLVTLNVLLTCDGQVTAAAPLLGAGLLFPVLEVLDLTCMVVYDEPTVHIVAPRLVHLKLSAVVPVIDGLISESLRSVRIKGRAIDYRAVLQILQCSAVLQHVVFGRIMTQSARVKKLSKTTKTLINRSLTRQNYSPSITIFDIYLNKT